MWLGKIKKMTRRSLRRRSTLVLLAATSGLAAAGITLAVAATTVPAPTITSAPASPTTQTSAHFTYTDSQAGVTYKCQIDNGAASACAATGITYPGPLAQETHTFKVQAIAGTKASAWTVYKWTVDTTAPTGSISFPKEGVTYTESTWSAGCSGKPGICGSVKDPSGVASTSVSIRQGNGKWWGGSSLNQATEYFNSATLASPGASSTTWSYSLAMPPTGSYTVHVRSADTLGNTTAPASQLSVAFATKSPPPTPIISSGPERNTTATTAKLAFSDSEAGVTFLCRLDASAFSKCTSPKSYTGLAAGAHTFYVEAQDGKGNVSAASYSWTIEAGVKFTISGSAAGPLAPGTSQSMPLAIKNPNTVPIYVTGLLVSVQTGSTKLGCDGPTNLQVTQSSASATNTVTVPAGGEVALPSGTVTAPQVLMKDLASNQDACKGASFTFNYTGSAHS
jgi:hypothetical protein